MKMMLLAIAFAAFAARAQTAEGPFKPESDSLKQYRCPEWFRDAKRSEERRVGKEC